MRPKITILCVDDNASVLSVRKFLLETHGYRVLAATGPGQAIEMFREGGIDLIVSDLVMPTMDGNELIRHMKEFAPVPTILVSGAVVNDYCSRADVFLPKGLLCPVELLATIKTLLARTRGPKKGTPSPRKGTGG